MSHPTQLAAKVAARNAVHAALIAAAPAYFALGAQFAGKKIRKADGSFTKEFRAALPVGAMGDYWLSSNYSLARVFKVCVNGPRHAAYAEATLYIGEIEGSTLKNVEYSAQFKPENFRTDYDAATIAGARLDVSAKRRALQEAESAISYFGEHDNN